ncbi:MAG: hypothetical protein KFF49_04110 [Bacteroidales bacterium]|nr:hypothetical protein [Bacteroidales bacterium]
MRNTVIIALLTFISSAAFAQDKAITVLTQNTWPPGTYVPVRIEIVNKGLNDFARFYQDLPQGFTVKKGNTAGADFYWDNKQVNFVWVKMPEDEIIRISYLARADKSLKGSFSLAGKLDYVVNDDRRHSVEYGPLIIYLDDNAVVEDDLESFYSEETPPGDLLKQDTIISTVQEEEAQKIEFRIQVAIASEQISKAELEDRIGSPLAHGIKVLRAGNIYKYQSGAFGNYQQASFYLADLKGRGVTDAFIVAYRGDEQISVSLARTLTE